MAGFGFFHVPNGALVGYQGQGFTCVSRSWGCPPIPVLLSAALSPRFVQPQMAPSRWQSGADESCDGSGGFGELHPGLLAALGERVAHAVVKVLVEQV